MCFPRFASAVAFLCFLPAALAQSPTAATLVITVGGSPVATVQQGTAVTLTATVTLAGGVAALPPGQVDFCEAQAPPLRCTDIRLLGTGQLSSAGTATLKLLPGPGTHNYLAVFIGTHVEASSSSGSAELTVTPSPSPTETVISASGVPGNYTLTATVTNFAPTPITGDVSFHDIGISNSVLASALLVPVAAPALSFVDGPQISVSPTYAEGIAVADFNNDGKLDLVASDCPSIPLVTPQPYQSLQVLLGNGNATFGSTSPEIIPGCGQSLAVADFNGDGKQDVAAAMLYADAVQIVLGNGDGTFTTGQVIPLPSPQAIVSADFNGDGIPDLAVTNVINNGATFSPNTVTILLGNGDGTFTVKSTMPAGSNPLAITVGDFNGDGKADLAIVDQASNSVTILLGNGDGTFAPAPSPAVGLGPNSIAAADFNGDGILDLAVLNKLNTSGPAAPGSVTILLGNGDGTFTPVGATPATGLVPVSIAVGDFNGDGKADLATANTGILPPPGESAASILLGNGDGTFVLASNTPAATLGVTPDEVVTADFDGSGVSDVAVGALAGFIGTILPQFGSEAVATVGGISPIGSGPHEVDAQYPGDSNNRPSTSNIIYLTAERGAATLTLTLNPAGPSYSYGQQFVLTVTINPIENLIPTGSLTISYQGIGTGIVLSPGGTVSTFPFNLLAQPVGTFPITVTYSGDSNYLPVTGSLTITVKPNLSAATLTSSLNPANAGQTVTFTATVSGASSSGVPPAGSVSFSDGATVLGTVPLVSGSGGASTAAFSTSTLAVGTHTITAAYVPAAGYATSAATLTQAINPAPVDFTITLSSPSVTLQTYQTTTTTVTLASLGGFADTLSLTCGSLPADVTCTLTPNSTKLAANATATASLYLSTVTIPSRNALNRSPQFPINLVLLLSPAGLFAALTARRRRRFSVFNFALLAAFSMTALTLSGCGSLIYPLPSATPGTYTIPITATGASTGLTHAAVLTLQIGS